MRDNIEGHINDVYQKIYDQLLVNGKISPEREEMVQEWRKIVQKYFASIYLMGAKIQKSKNLDDLMNKLNLADNIFEDITIDIGAIERRMQLQIIAARKENLESEINQLSKLKENLKVKGEGIISQSSSNLNKLKELSSAQKNHDYSYKAALLYYLMQISDKICYHIPQITEIAREDYYMHSLIRTLKKSLESYSRIPTHYEILNEFQNNKAATIKIIFTSNSQVKL